MSLSTIILKVPRLYDLCKVVAVFAACRFCYQNPVTGFCYALGGFMILNTVDYYLRRSKYTPFN